LHADAENVLRGGVEVEDEQAGVEDGDAGAQRIEYSPGPVLLVSIAAAAAGCFAAVQGAPVLTVLCCT
jgi:hypothetical protein